MSDKHTPEPWEWGDVEIDCPTDDFYSEAIKAGPAEVPSLSNPERAEADARRIVACVNACAGIPTEDLEASVPGSLRMAVTALETIEADQKSRDNDIVAREAFALMKWRGHG